MAMAFESVTQAVSLQACEISRNLACQADRPAGKRGWRPVRFLYCSIVDRRLRCGCSDLF